MKHSFKVGFSFGVTSGIITTLGLMIGLYSGTHSKLAVLGGIITIAIADAFSDSLGIHISEESENKHTAKEIWISTFSTFVSKFVLAMTFVVPVLLLSLRNAIAVSIIWGLLLLSILSYTIACEEKVNRWKVIIEHLFIAVLVIVLTYLIGIWISRVFV
ncbi:MAG: hypothetical protein P9M13_06710 [Candidatus Ancaeobacter aquaticus]|nr:hypothetical protein [Candidatus Ancaeobacter aquaticus]